MRPVFDPSAVHHLKHKGAVDADGHVLEDAGLWDRYIEAKYRDRALRMKRDADGLEYLEIGGVPSKRTRNGYPATLGRMDQKDLDAFKPHPDKTYAANMPYGACNAEERLKLLDAEGLDALSVGLSSSQPHRRLPAGAGRDGGLSSHSGPRRPFGRQRAPGVRLLRSTLRCACLETSRPALSGTMSGAPGKASEA